MSDADRRIVPFFQRVEDGEAATVVAKSMRIGNSKRARWLRQGSPERALFRDHVQRMAEADRASRVEGLLLLVAEGASVHAAAKHMGVASSTAYRALAHPDAIRQLAEATTVADRVQAFLLQQCSTHSLVALGQLGDELIQSAGEGGDRDLDLLKHGIRCHEIVVKASTAPGAKGVVNNVSVSATANAASASTAPAGVDTAHSWFKAIQDRGGFAAVVEAGEGERDAG